MLKDEDVFNEGFLPLRKNPTEPQVMKSKNNEGEIKSALLVNQDTGEMEREKNLYDSSSWAKMQKSRGKMMERGNSFIGSRTRAESVGGYDNKVIVIVDPFSTGAHLASAVVETGYKCARVFSIWDSPVAALVQEGVMVDYFATIQHNDAQGDTDAAIDEVRVSTGYRAAPASCCPAAKSLSRTIIHSPMHPASPIPHPPSTLSTQSTPPPLTTKTVAALRSLPFEIIAVIAGAETGVELADSLSARMGLRSNGEAKSLARRNKYIMGEAVRATGVRAVLQRACTSAPEVVEFLKQLTAVPLKCVVKPVQSAGTDDVFLCSSEQEALTAFSRIFMKRNGLGLVNESVLVQEFLVGKEYVIDKVTRDGVHKLVAIWEYDKRSVNGANFVYFGMRLCHPDSPRSQAMVAYADHVLNALDIMQGPSHMEVMFSEVGGPCLVEVGSRCQGGEGTWLPVAKECIGYTQVEVTLDAYTSGRLFATLAKDTYPIRKYGRELDMVNRQGGIVRSLPGESTIRALPSFRSLSWEVKPGDYAPVTIDCFTRPGCVQLVHESKTQADADFESVHALEPMGLIDYMVICPSPPVLGAIVVVDPFSTGANLAAMAVNWGYRLILVFAEMDSPVAKLVAKGTTLSPILMIQHNNNNSNREEAISETLSALDKVAVPVLAIIPGAETGVELADRLAARFGTRNNGEEWTDARRNKFAMQEAVRKAGVRAVKQRLCRSEADVESFLSTLSSLKLVVKPNESAGSDQVFLCHSRDEALRAFLSIHQHSNGLGQINDGALCQEFLSGTEYVVDGCARDGVYKVTAIWKYDKRSVNGANFVYFGMRLCDGSGEREKALTDYAKRVVNALHIMHGPSHMEVMYSEVDGPCLVEVGSRCHGGEATWLPVVKECIGYSQLEATLNCYLRPDTFDSMPETPTLLRRGAEAFLVSMSQKPGGVLKDIPGLEVIRSMSSFRRLEMLTQPGSVLPPTIDCFTRPGSVQMVNESEAKLEEDYAHIRELEISGLFEVI